MANANVATTQTAPTKQSDPPKKTVTIVINNREGFHVGQLGHREQPSIPGRPPRLILGDQVVFGPALDFYDSDKLIELRLNPKFDALFTTKIPMMKAPEQRAEMVGRPFMEQHEVLPAEKPLSALTSERAIWVVNEIVNEGLLERLRNEEGRESVRLAIMQRLEYIATGGGQSPQADNF